MSDSTRILGRKINRAEDLQSSGSTFEGPGEFAEDSLRLYCLG